MGYVLLPWWVHFTNPTPSLLTRSTWVETDLPSPHTQGQVKWQCWVWLQIRELTVETGELKFGAWCAHIYSYIGTFASINVFGGNYFETQEWGVIAMWYHQTAQKGRRWMCVYSTVFLFGFSEQPIVIEVAVKVRPLGLQAHIFLFIVAVLNAAFPSSGHHSICCCTRLIMKCCCG